MRILILDIETAPHIVHAWGLYDVNVGLNQIVKPGGILCWAAKWHGEKKMFFDSVQRAGTKEMLRSVHALMDEADVIVGWNSKHFDIPWIQGQFIVHKIKPPSPFKQLDLFETSKRQCKLASNKLEYVATVLGLGSKVKHVGHELWTQCMAGNRAAWRTMRKYNEHDVTLTEKVYDRFLPFIRTHPNHGVYGDATVPVCTHCGSNEVRPRGWAYTELNKYRRFKCRGCGKWLRNNSNVFTKRDRAAILRPVLG